MSADVAETTALNRNSASNIIDSSCIEANVMLDDSARLIDDPDHSEDEARFLLVGQSLEARCLVVSHCYRHSESVIRLISARPATGLEEAMYWRLK